jgi:CPA1 family monovalent cation:H+ antiporter
LKVSTTLRTIVECESLFNDAVAVSLYRTILTALSVAGATTAAMALVAASSFAEAIAGAALGVVLAFVVASVLRRSIDATMQIPATIFGAYGAYFAADVVHLSGIFATISFGIALRFYERAWISLTVAEDVNRFWDIAALVANVIVFFMVGAALHIGHMVQEPFFALACLVAIAIARIVISELLLPLAYPREWIGVARAAGMRGALSLALALTIPASVPYRQAIIDATLAVALVTLAAGTFTITPAVRRAARARR